MIENIIKVFEFADDNDIKFGLAWYPYANYVCRKIAAKTKVPLSRVCAVMSALSPQNRWEQNMVDTENLIIGWLNKNTENVKVSTFNSNKQKAINILNGNDISDELRGPKTWAFYNNILNPMSNHVTIDFHAFDIYAMNTKKKSLSLRKYEKISSAYIEAANQLNLHPSSLQAITWCTWRNKKYEIINSIDGHNEQ